MVLIVLPRVSRTLDPVRRNSNVKKSKEDRSRLLKALILFPFSSQNAMVSFKELCGLTPAANMKQCILTVSTWLMNSERSLRVTVDLSEAYPAMEAQGPVPELLRKVLNAYDMVTTRAWRLLRPVSAPNAAFSRVRTEVGRLSVFARQRRPQRRGGGITRQALDKNNLPFFLAFQTSGILSCQSRFHASVHNRCFGKEELYGLKSTFLSVTG